MRPPYRSGRLSPGHLAGLSIANRERVGHITDRGLHNKELKFGPNTRKEQ
jgi:hypothetical protein